MGVMHKNTATAGLGNPGTSAETVIYTTPAIQTGAGMGPIGIRVTTSITPGTGTTAIVLRVRQGGLTGPIVGPAFTHTVAAGAVQTMTFATTDNTTFTEQAGGGSYVVTAQQTGGTGNGTTNAVDAEVII
jgi:hypothetical protein